MRMTNERNGNSTETRSRAKGSSLPVLHYRRTFALLFSSVRRVEFLPPPLSNRSRGRKSTVSFIFAQLIRFVSFGIDRGKESGGGLLGVPRGGNVETRPKENRARCLVRCLVHTPDRASPRLASLIAHAAKQRRISDRRRRGTHQRAGGPLRCLHCLLPRERNYIHGRGKGGNTGRGEGDVSIKRAYISLSADRDHFPLGLGASPVYPAY